MKHNDNVCWHNGGGCKNPVVKHFLHIKKGQEISICQAHSSPYHKSEDYELARVVVPW